MKITEGILPKERFAPTKQAKPRKQPIYRFGNGYAVVSGVGLGCWSARPPCQSKSCPLDIINFHGVEDPLLIKLPTVWFLKADHYILCRDLWRGASARCHSLWSSCFMVPFIDRLFLQTKTLLNKSYHSKPPYLYCILINILHLNHILNFSRHSRYNEIFLRTFNTSHLWLWWLIGLVGLQQK